MVVCWETGQREKEETERQNIRNKSMEKVEHGKLGHEIWRGETHSQSLPGFLFGSVKRHLAKTS